MIAYKLMRKRKDGTYGPLFINRKQRLKMGDTRYSEPHRTKGYTFRPGWHCCALPYAPHLKQGEGRVWLEVMMTGLERHERPMSQGGTWYTGELMTLLKELSDEDVNKLLTRRDPTLIHHQLGE